MNNKQQYCIITIDNFPSRAELIYILNNFLTQNNHPKNYKWENRGNGVDIIFSDKVVGLEFLRRMENEKTKNTLYAKTNITMAIKSNTHGYPYNKSDSDARNVSFSGLELNSLSSKLSLKKKSSAAIYSHPSEGVKHSYSHNHLLDVAGKAGVIANDSPYISQLQKLAKEAKANEKKWVSKNNFCLFINKSNSQSHMIHNYVMRTPSIPICNYNFRGIYKDKWVDKKDFRPW